MNYEYKSTVSISNINTVRLGYKKALKVLISRLFLFNKFLDAYLAAENLFATSSQLTTFQKAET